MNISRRDDRHNADLAKEISDSFNRAIGQRKTDDPGTGDDPDGTEGDGADATEQASPHFVITGDRRNTGRRRRP
ncbi:hypothetical protein LY13_004674 [Prauserella aidingensis]|uniref:hypothetical protein n=1 Tax=Prauserella aidingensis TaxID=387890 RepID=UPI0020A337AF|nr:hypothetical protein [Prauserella aidingensis]MCP2255892.1 hypothetical protein [Prauserella aidingensis]